MERSKKLRKSQLCTNPPEKPAEAFPCATGRVWDAPVGSTGGSAGAAGSLGSAPIQEELLGHQHLPSFLSKALRDEIPALHPPHPPHPTSSSLSHHVAPQHSRDFSHPNPLQALLPSHLCQVFLLQQHRFWDFFPRFCALTSIKILPWTVTALPCEGFVTLELLMEFLPLEKWEYPKPTTEQSKCSAGNHKVPRNSFPSLKISLGSPWNEQIPLQARPGIWGKEQPLMFLGSPKAALNEKMGKERPLLPHSSTQSTFLGQLQKFKTIPETSIWQNISRAWNPKSSQEECWDGSGGDKSIKFLLNLKQ